MVRTSSCRSVSCSASKLLLLLLLLLSAEKKLSMACSSWHSHGHLQASALSREAMQKCARGDMSMGHSWLASC